MTAGSTSAKPLDYNSLRPYYAQILDQLRQEMRDGVRKAGEMLPSEAELCSTFAVSRTVVRRALQELEYEGLIYRKQGKGSFVAERKLQELLIQQLTGFHQDMVSQGHAIANRVLRLEEGQADEVAAEALGLAGERVIILERLRVVDGLPVNVSISFVPVQHCPELLSADLTEGSLYAFIEAHCGQRIVRGRRTIEAIRPTAQMTELLEIEPDLPVFKITNTCFLADGTAIEHSRGYHRSDRTQFQVELLRTTNVGPGVMPVSADLPQSHTLAV